MTLHPTLKEIITVTKEANNPPLSRLPLAEIRKGPMKMRPLAGEPVPVAKVMNHIIHHEEGNLLIRLYYPKENTSLPVLLYFHPGGFVKGDIDAHDPTCRALADASGCLVASMNYPLAPENPYPKALHAAKAVLHWISAHPKEIGSDGRIAIGGEDAGGNLAAVLSQEVRDEPHPQISYQVLVYPQTDFTFSSLSHQEYGRGYLLEKESMEWYRKQYLKGDEDPRHPQISPLYASDFSSLPPAFIVTAEYDPMRDEGESYAKKLKASGVPVTLKRYSGMVHGFFQMAGLLDEARAAIVAVGETLKTHFRIT
ncbi:MAG: alpha/beta hydrolase [Chlamydiia bacterium]|nr:alpha/beta hydrolase [Chlamydiia bacterium]